MVLPPNQDERIRTALARYKPVAAYVALAPERGARRKLLEQLASQTWHDENGEIMSMQAETLRVWVRRYRRGGLNALMDKPHPKRGVGVLSAEQCELVARLKLEVPERSVERIITIAQEMKYVEDGVLKRSTVHRVLQSRGISARKARVADRHDLDRFEAEYSNDLWQSDMLQGPYLPDPEHPGKVRRTALFAFLDDHSRLVLDGRFSFRENLPALELVFRRAVQKWGIPRRVYYDNGQVYRAEHMAQIVAHLGIYRIVFTKVRRPMGHGKIEALNRLIVSAFLAELRASNIRTLDELNEAFQAWVDLSYHTTVHSETGQTPVNRWRSDIGKMRYAEEEALRQAFLWKEVRTPDKSGVFSLLGIRYQVGPKLARRKIQVRFDPEAMHEVEAWHQDTFVERVKPLQIRPCRRPQIGSEIQEETTTQPKTNWLGNLVERRRQQTVPTPPKAQSPHEQANSTVVKLLASHLDEAVVDELAARDWLNRYGPLDPERASIVLEALFQRGMPRDHHVTFYLQHIKETQS
jgi:transposase InsO family protein